VEETLLVETAIEPVVEEALLMETADAISPKLRDIISKTLKAARIERALESMALTLRQLRNRVRDS
jgi:hypothetical protein